MHQRSTRSYMTSSAREDRAYSKKFSWAQDKSGTPEPISTHVLENDQKMMESTRTWKIVI